MFKITGNPQRITELLNIEYPIIEGGMAWVGTSSLAASVSNAGGLGLIGAGNMEISQLQQSIDQIKQLTDKTYGVNLIMIHPEVEKMIALVIKEKVPVVALAAGNPGKYISSLKNAGIKVIAVVASDLLALRLQRQGVDIIVGEGSECGGHIGEVATLPLITRLTTKLSVPVVAAGGISDQKSALACLTLGASGVQMGTRFIATDECEAHPEYKNQIIKAGLRDTIITGNRLGHPVRVLKTPFAKKIAALEVTSLAQAEKMLIGSLKKAFLNGDLTEGSFMAGQSVGCIDSILPVAEIVANIGGCLNQFRKELCL